MTEELKPCPFCGGKAWIMLVAVCGAKRVGCDTCDIYTPYVINEHIALAIAAWNRRATPRWEKVVGPRRADANSPELPERGAVRCWPWRHKWHHADGGHLLLQDKVLLRVRICLRCDAIDWSWRFTS